MNLTGQADMENNGYRVLARKYRPSSFDTLIGQDVLVRTLSNAIKTGRLAHAFLLTGIRGVGKTTTARIIARALNCIGEDGTGGATITPCGVCANCTMIAEDRHMDVIEMDAASRTGVGDIRELIETVHYAPTNARYKIYIIDEVHMLSNNAFNALLKTLEEPPPHVKFIFATTELRKIPVTILSRCQKFDLKRVDGEELAAHLARICTKEQVEAQQEALQLIAGAAEGSVRDALSLLDQAIAHGTSDDGTTRIEAALVRDMLGMADRTQSFVLLERLFAGEVEPALKGFKAQYDDGGDPAYLLQELMELVHLTTRMKLVPELAQSHELAEQERKHAQELAGKLGVAQLTRAWQILGKGLQEVRVAPNPYIAAEMVLIRLLHASHLPTPADVIRKIQDGTLSGIGGSTTPAGGGTTAQGALQGGATPPATSHTPSAQASAGYSAPQAQHAIQTQPQMQSAPYARLHTQSQPLALPAIEPSVAALDSPQDFAQLVELFSQQRELVLWTHLHQNTRLVRFEQGRLELNTSDMVPNDFAGRVGKCLTEWTGQRWVVVISAQAGEPSLKAQADAVKAGRLDEARQHPLVQQLLSQFSGAKVIDFAPPERHPVIEDAPATADTFDSYEPDSESPNEE